MIYKKIFLLLLLFSCFGCDEPNIQEKGTGVKVDNAGNEIKVVHYEGCEYLYLTKDRGVALTHKGNCSNPIHN